MSGPSTSYGSAKGDAALLRLEEQFVTVTAELSRKVDRVRQGLADEAQTKADEHVLARLAPIEQAIMETPAETIVGLSVKARHVASVLSEHWQAPADQINWEARAVRLLIESICDVARTPLVWQKTTIQK